MKSFLPLFIAALIFNVSAVVAQEATPRTPFSIGETIQFQSEILNETRTLNIYLPLGYSPDSAKTYPVIYLLDGTDNEDFIHIAGLVQFNSFSWINNIPETIVVGIANVDRQRDFTHMPQNKEYLENVPTGGGSEQFIQFIEKELQPFIAKQYKLSGERTLIGQSLGGLLASEVLLRHPDLFENYLIISPSLWWDDEFLLGVNSVSYSGSKKIYIAVGAEGRIMKRVAKSLHKKIKAIGHPKTELHYSYFKDLNHGDALHLSVYEGFVKLFSVKP